MAELLMATVSRGVQAAADAHLAHAACAGGHAGVPLALPPLPPLPPPMVTGNYEANATSCHLQVLWGAACVRPLHGMMAVVEKGA